MTDKLSLLSLLKQYSHPRYWLTWIGLAFIRLLVMLPLPILAVSGYLIGSIAYCVMGKRRAIAYKNIRVCFPEWTERQCTVTNYKHFCYLGQMILTTCMNWWISSARFDRLVTIHNREHYDQAIADGNNIILLSPHFLAIEISGLALQRERKMVGMYQYMKNPILNIMAIQGRSRFSTNAGMFERKAPLRGILREINKGCPFSYYPDQDAMRKGVFVPFFHTLASTTPALSKFVGVTKAVVIPARNVMKPWGMGYDVYLGEPVQGLNTKDEIVDTTVMNKSIEMMVRETPEQYLWVHKRYKTRPEGEPKFYK